MKRRRALAALLALLTVVATAGCGGAEHTAARELFALDTYQVDGDTGFEATALVKLDRRTLRPVGQRLLLGEAVDEDLGDIAPVLSPDRKTLALGGYNFGDLLFVDPERMKLTGRLQVAPAQAPADIQIQVLAWPRPSRLVALATAGGPWWAPHPSKLVVVDPERKRVLLRVPVGDAVGAASVLHGRTVVLLRLRPRFGGIESGVPLLETIGPDGRIRSLPLTRLALTGGRSLRVAGSVFRAERPAAVATDGRRRAFVVVADRPIAEVDVPSLTVRYHSVRLRHQYVAAPGPTTPGSGGVHLRYSRSATWLGGGMLSISGYDELPVALAGGMIGHSEPPTRTQVIDAHSWRLIRSLPATFCQATGHVILCSGDVVVRGSGSDAVDTALVAYDRRWHVRFRKGPAPLYWQLVAGRLLVNRDEGPTFELAQMSGKRIRRVFPPQFATTFFTWTSRT